MKKLFRVFLCAVGVHDESPMAIHDHEGGFSHYDVHCTRCRKEWEVWFERYTGKVRRTAK